MWIVWTIGILALLYLLVSAGVALIMPELLLKAKGKRRRTYEQVRREQTALGHVDYEAYDKLEKESFILRGDGADISGEFLPADPSPAPGERPRCLIRVHGYTQNRMLSVRFMKVFREMGYASVIYDQRGFGESTGMCTMGYLEKYDLSLAIDWVKARLGADTLIGVHGESMGGITAMEALGIDSRIDFLVEDGGATDMREFSRFELRRQLRILPAFPALPLAEFILKRRYGFDFGDVRPIERVRNADVPILFLHGTADEQMPVAMCPALYGAAKHPLSRMELFEGATHCHGHAKEPERYEAVIRRFVEDVEAALLSPPLD